MGVGEADDDSLGSPVAPPPLSQQLRRRGRCRLLRDVHWMCLLVWRMWRRVLWGELCGGVRKVAVRGCVG